MLFDFAHRVVWRLGRDHGYRLAAHRQSKILRLLEAASECYLNYFKNRSYDFAKNGEQRVMRKLCLAPGDVVFDVGAHCGHYSALLLAEQPRIVLHAFELNPRNAEKFASTVQRCSSAGFVRLHTFGLGSSDGTFQVTDTGGDGQITSLHSLLGGEGMTLEVQVKRGDQVLRDPRISKLRFLKVDTEGNDLEVLRGFGEFLTPSFIGVIQFEYNETSVAARVMLKDFYDLLEPKGYVLGKVYPQGVEFSAYDVHFEDHRASNYLAVGSGSEDQGFFSA